MTAQQVPIRPIASKYCPCDCSKGPLADSAQLNTNCLQSPNVVSFIDAQGTTLLQSPRARWSYADRQGAQARSMHSPDCSHQSSAWRQAVLCAARPAQITAATWSASARAGGPCAAAWSGRLSRRWPECISMLQKCLPGHQRSWPWHRKALVKSQRTGTQSTTPCPPCVAARPRTRPALSRRPRRGARLQLDDAGRAPMRTPRRQGAAGEAAVQLSGPVCQVERGEWGARCCIVGWLRRVATCWHSKWRYNKWRTANSWGVCKQLGVCGRTRT